jgi:hypothetical protein
MEVGHNEESLDFCLGVLRSMGRTPSSNASKKWFLLLILLDAKGAKY